MKNKLSNLFFAFLGIFDNNLDKKKTKKGSAK